ncbi:MAG: flagellar basal body P-ring protein FlgI, partial [Planctomycetota bacterium]
MKSTKSKSAKEQDSTTTLVTCLLISCVLMVSVGRCERIKDIVDIQGIRSNPLRGVGLVIGLAGNGD